MPSISKSHRWSEVKRCVSTYDSKDLIRLLQDLYEISAENKRFLHARCLGREAERGEYRKRIIAAVYPDPLGSRSVQVHEALRMIRQYQRASGDFEGTVDLFLAALEAGVEQAVDLGMYEEYFSSLTNMVEAFVQIDQELPSDERRKTRARFREIAKRGNRIGWGFGDYLQETLATLEES